MTNNGEENLEERLLPDLPEDETLRKLKGAMFKTGIVLGNYATKALKAVGKGLLYVYVTNPYHYYKNNQDDHVFGPAVLTMTTFATWIITGACFYPYMPPETQNYIKDLLLIN